ncbi:hypothetical protein NEFER03_0255 [Nematocida sp. LUAm3]|nr:hypothetical protein NEFER03_0255 [Nematocida sp. LUAm3]KAI5173708.1 hypothetical protein NEFER02_0224 [Nematocida sp. LUAm2]KAI5176930.1 hypothetical protein NEFER01_0255 [Nematocida sp. LUAm1]
MHYEFIKWHQDTNQTIISIELPNTNSKGIKVSIINSILEVLQNNQLILKEKMAYPNKEEESTWSIEDGIVEVVLVKKQSGTWNRLFESDAPDSIKDDLKDAPTSDISSFDAETQREIRKFYYETINKG